jgi:RNA recognition motif-containing protein
MHNLTIEGRSIDSKFDFESLLSTPDTYIESIFGAASTESNFSEHIQQVSISGNCSPVQDKPVTYNSPSFGHENAYDCLSSYDGSKQPSLPEFVRNFTSCEAPIDQKDCALTSRDLLRSMFNTLEKPQLIEMLSQAIFDSKDVADRVRSSIGRLAVFRRLLVRNISFQSTSDDVKFVLSSRFGPIEEGTVVYDRISGRSKGFAFMTFVSVDSACNAIMDSLNGLIELDGRQLILKFAADRVDAGGENQNPSPSYTLGGASILTPMISPVENPRALRKLFVYNLSLATTSETLGSVFGQYGPIEECLVVVDSCGVSKRYAFVTYTTEDSAWRCLEEPSKLIDGQMTFTHLASEGPSYGNHRKQATVLTQLLDGLICGN